MLYFLAGREFSYGTMLNKQTMVFTGKPTAQACKTVFCYTPLTVLAAFLSHRRMDCLLHEWKQSFVFLQVLFKINLKTISAQVILTYFELQSQVLKWQTISASLQVFAFIANILQYYILAEAYARLQFYWRWHVNGSWHRKRIHVIILERTKLIAKNDKLNCKIKIHCGLSGYGIIWVKLGYM